MVRTWPVVFGEGYEISTENRTFFFSVNSTLINRKKNHDPIPVSRCNGVLSQIVWDTLCFYGIITQEWRDRKKHPSIYLFIWSTTKCPIIIRKHGSVWPVYTDYCVHPRFTFVDSKRWIIFLYKIISRKNYNTFFYQRIFMSFSSLNARVITLATMPVIITFLLAIFFFYFFN